MNRYPNWVNWLLLIIVVAGTIIALPNVYGDDPAVYVASEDGMPVTEAVLPELRSVLDEAGIAYGAVAIEEPAAIVRFADVNEQLRARDLIDTSLEGHSASLMLAPRTPGWLRALGLRPMSLGLDLQGGVHFVFQVDIESAIEQLLDNYSETLTDDFQEADIRASTSIEGRTLIVRPISDDPAVADQVRDILEDLEDVSALATTPRLEIENTEIDGRPAFRVTPTEVLIRERQDFAIEQNTLTLRNRINALGVSEPIVQRQGLDQILVQLPGVQDPDRADRILGATATLEFRALNYENDPVEIQRSGRQLVCCELYTDPSGQLILLNRRPIVTGDQVIDATPGTDNYSRPAVNVTLDGPGGDRMLAFTRDSVGRNMAVVYIEEIPHTAVRDGVEVIETETDERVISNAQIQGVFSNNFQVTGLTPIEARDLALQLRAGALATPIVKVEQRTIGPTLGADNIAKGRLAVIVGFLLVVGFMLLYYRVFGIFANAALLMNLILLVALMSMLPTALTLPGIAGIVLTLGMAVDANVLINERIREELRNGNTPQASIKAGYEKAFSSIADANITTLIAALVLFVYGTGPIRGFAVTLTLGLLTSMYTSIVGTRVLANLVYGRRKDVKRLSIGGGN
jgi:preprotein translocase subunit SecD